MEKSLIHLHYLMKFVTMGMHLITETVKTIAQVVFQDTLVQQEVEQLLLFVHKLVGTESLLFLKLVMMVQMIILDVQQDVQE